MPDVKNILFVQTKAPHGSIAGQEGLDAILAGSAFTSCNVLLLEDGVYQLLDNQDTNALGVKDFSVTYGALADYGVENLFVAGSHLAARGLEAKDLLLNAEVLDDDAVRGVLAKADAILSF